MSPDGRAPGYPLVAAHDPPKQECDWNVLKKLYNFGVKSGICKNLPKGKRK